MARLVKLDPPTHEQREKLNNLLRLRRLLELGSKRYRNIYHSGESDLWTQYYLHEDRRQDSIKRWGFDPGNQYGWVKELFGDC
jgi:hypothetical protein